MKRLLVVVSTVSPRSFALVAIGEIVGIDAVSGFSAAAALLASDRQHCPALTRALNVPTRPCVLWRTRVNT
jgi:hypothetical protein